MYQTNYSNPLSVVPIDIATIGKATKAILFAAYALVEPDIIAALVARAKAGVSISIYLDRTEICAEARGDATMSKSPFHALMGVPNIAIKVKHSVILMHLKSYLVDGIILRDGSANFSVPGEEEQDNSLTLTDDLTACTLFQAKFIAMWSRQDNLSIAEAVQTNSQHAEGHASRH